MSHSETAFIAVCFAWVGTANTRKMRLHLPLSQRALWRIRLPLLMHRCPPKALPDLPSALLLLLKLSHLQRVLASLAPSASGAQIAQRVRSPTDSRCATIAPLTVRCVAPGPLLLTRSWTHLHPCCLRRFPDQKLPFLRQHCLRRFPPQQIPS